MSEYEDLITRLEAMNRRREAESRAVIEVDFIAEGATEHWVKDGLDFYICQNALWDELMLTQRITGYDYAKRFGQWNGYVKFPKLPGLIPGWRGIYTYVPVHGGITFFQEWADGAVTYGFDCAHAWSGQSPVHDLGWVRLETESMARSIRIAARFERYYLRAGEDNNKKARVIDRMGKFLPVDPRDNFGVMLNLLGGEL